MKNTRQTGTAAEIAVRKELHRRGHRYRVDYKVLDKPRRVADIVFTKHKVAVFIDGCFWHGCPKHATSSKSNAAFWKDKIETNQRRDLDTNERLKQAGWLVIRAWEHEDPEKVAIKIAKKVRARMK